MGTRGTQRSLCCHPLFSTGALWCPSTHIRYGRPGAKEPHAERPSPPSHPALAGQQYLCTSAASLLRVAASPLISATLPPPPGLLCLPSHTCSPHLFPFCKSSQCSVPSSPCICSIVSKGNYLVQAFLCQNSGPAAMATLKSPQDTFYFSSSLRM